MLHGYEIRECSTEHTLSDNYVDRTFDLFEGIMNVGHLMQRREEEKRIEIEINKKKQLNFNNRCKRMLAAD